MSAAQKPWAAWGWEFCAGAMLLAGSSGDVWAVTSPVALRLEGAVRPQQEQGTASPVPGVCAWGTVSLLSLLLSAHVPLGLPGNVSLC